MGGRPRKVLRASGSFRALLRGTSERTPSGACKILSIYEFDDVHVDPRAFRVWKAGRPVALEPKAFEVLLFLVENPGRLVEKKELLERVWPDTVVTESAMTRVIADLRKALGDPAREARYIETVPTRGYRFIAEVRKAPDDAAIPQAPPGLEPASASRLLPPRLLWFAAGAVGLVVLLVGFRAMRHRPSPAASPAPAPPHTLQVSDSLGLDLFPSFSPDGAEIAYASDRGGGFEIFVRQLAPGGREIQITADGQDNLQPAWSPTGQEIAFSSRKRSGIWLVPALGGAPRRLTDFGSHPGWSPDGSALVFQSSGVTDIAAGGPAVVSPSSLFTVPRAGGSPVTLTRPGAPPGGHGAPSFSPDGRWIAFTAWGGHVSEIWRVSRDGSELDRVTPSRPTSAYYESVHSPRGDWLYFAVSSGGWLNFSLYRSRVPVKRGDTWGDPELVRAAGAAALRHPAVSPDGAHLAYSAPRDTSNLWSLHVDLPRGEPSDPPVLLTHAAGCRNTAPAFSHVGDRIAFVSCQAGTSHNIWVMDSNGEHAEPLTTGLESNYWPGWFPDGKRVAFLSSRGGRDTFSSIALPDRREMKLLDFASRTEHVCLSPDGTSLAFTKVSGGVRNVWVTPVKDNSPRQLTFDRESAGFAAWSPDGRHLALNVNRGPDSQLAVVPAAGGEIEVLTHSAGQAWSGTWSPDGERIVFAGQRDGIWNLYWISRRGGTEHRLTDYANRHSFVRYPAWSPRDDQIVYEYAETTGNVWLMDPPR